MSVKQELEKYTRELFALTEVKANVSEFITLYVATFGEQPSDRLITSYKKTINDEDEDTSSYQYQYDSSYSYGSSYC